MTSSFKDVHSIWKHNVSKHWLTVDVVFIIGCALQPYSLFSCTSLPTLFSAYWPAVALFAKRLFADLFSALGEVSIGCFSALSLPTHPLLIGRRWRILQRDSLLVLPAFVWLLHFCRISAIYPSFVPPYPPSSELVGRKWWIFKGICLLIYFSALDSLHTVITETLLQTPRSSFLKEATHCGRT